MSEGEHSRLAKGCCDSVLGRRVMWGKPQGRACGVQKKKIPTPTSAPAGIPRRIESQSTMFSPICAC